MAGALLCSPPPPPPHLSSSSPKPHKCSLDPSLSSCLLSPSHFFQDQKHHPVAESISTGLSEIYQICNIWSWRGYNISYLVKGNGPPVLLVHGFGASIAHWRRNIGIMAEKSTVYAIDLLGFGASDKPPASWLCLHNGNLGSVDTGFLG